MQKIRVKINYELEIPDDWKILSPSEDEGDHLMINGRYYLPDLMWMEYKGKNAEGHEEWTGVDDEMFELLADHTDVWDRMFDKTNKAIFSKFTGG